MIIWDGFKLIEAAISGAFIFIILAMIGIGWVLMKYDQWKKGRK